MFKLAEYATRDRFRVPTFSVLLLIHVLALAAPFTFTWAGLILFVVLAHITGSLGISMCYHRLLTHTSFKTHKWVKYILVFIASLALQGGPIYWVATHRLHHRESDKPMDPHSPSVSFLWAHVLWNFFDHPKLATKEDLGAIAPDLMEDPVLRFFETFFFPIFLLMALVTYGIGYAIGGLELGLSLVVWGFALRTVYVWHVTWLINSYTHKWGYRNYNSPDTSTNSWWMSWFSFGEALHNNHHGKQRCAKFAHRWFEVDTTYITLRVMQLLGLAWDVILPPSRAERNVLVPKKVAQNLS